MAYRANAPLWTLPASPGLLSNKYASGETFTARYSSSGGSQDPIGTVRVTAQRISDGQMLWDSGVVGRPTTISPPTSILEHFGTQILVSQNGALVVPGGWITTTPTATNDAYSAPTLGGSNGTWTRQPGALNAFVSPPAVGAQRNRAVSGTATFAMNGTQYVYMVGGDDYLGTGVTPYPAFNSVGWAVLNPDGTFGAWQIGPALPGPALDFVACCIAWTASGWFLYALGGRNASTGVPVNTTYYAQIQSDGSLGTWASGSSLPASVCAGFAVAIQGAVWYVGGATTGSGASQSIVYAAILNTNGSLNAWNNLGSYLTTAVREAAWIVAPIPNTNNAFSVIVLGGIGPSTSLTSTVQHFWIDFSSGPVLHSGGTIGTIPQAGADGGAALVTVGSAMYVYLLTGSSTNLYSAPLTFSGSTPSLGSWSHGVGATALQASDLGTGGALILNGDGTQDLTFAYGGFGASGTAPSAGDSVIFTVQVVGNISGMPSPTSSTSVVFGDPPTVASLAQSGGGSPAITFSFVQGNGGGPEQQWEVQLLDGGGNVLADSGLVFGSANSFTANAPNPRLVAGSSYTVKVLNVSTTDIPYPGSTDTATTVTLAFTGSASLTPVATPALSAVPDSANGAASLTITNPTPPQAPASSSAPAPTHDSSSGSSLTTGNPYWVAVAFADANLNVGPAYMAGSVSVASNGQRVLEAVTVPASASNIYLGVYIAKSASQPAFSAMHLFALVNVSTGVITYQGSNSSGLGSSVAGSLVTVTFSAVDNGSGAVPATSSTVSYAATNRVYYRPTGATAWVLLKNVATGFALGSTPTNTSAPNPPGGTVSVALYDQIRLGTAYDFAVSAVAVQFAAESAMSAVSSLTVLLNGYTATLHVAGNGAAQHMGLLELPGQRNVKEYLDNPLSLMYGNAALSSRSGPGDYTEVATQILLLSPADLATLQGILATAKAGGVVYWRDIQGGMWPCACSVITASTTTASREFGTLSLGYRRTAKLYLSQIAYQYQP